MNEPKKNRRDFLATVGAAGAASIVAGSTGTLASFAAEGKQKLAIDGGTPVRPTQLRYRPYGPQFYDDVEKQQLIDVLQSKAPFRWDSEDSKVLQFEQAYADHIHLASKSSHACHRLSDVEPDQTPGNYR